MSRKLNRTTISCKRAAQAFQRYRAPSICNTYSSCLLAGVLCIENFASLEECEALKQRGNQIVKDFDPKNITIFSSRNRGEQVLASSPITVLQHEGRPSEQEQSAHHP